MPLQVSERDDLEGREARRVRERRAVVDRGGERVAGAPEQRSLVDAPERLERVDDRHAARQGRRAGRRRAVAQRRPVQHDARAAAGPVKAPRGPRRVVQAPVAQLALGHGLPERDLRRRRERDEAQRVHS